MIHVEKTAIIAPDVKIGDGTKVWNFTQIREGVAIGENCTISNGVYIDAGVKIGNNVSIQNKALIYRNAVIEDDVFIGPAVCFANDKHPRSGVVRDLSDISWFVRKGASIGAGAIIMPDIEIGEYAMIGASAVVTKSVPAHGLVYGNPARLIGFVCKCGKKLTTCYKKDNMIMMRCECGTENVINENMADIDPIKSSKNWLLFSGIQNITADTRTDGGFNSWYDADTGTYPYIYSEITGYGITTLLYLYNKNKEEILLEHAKMAADWLINVAVHATGGVKTRFYYKYANNSADEQNFYSFDSEIIYSFDNGMVMYALTNLYKLTGIDAYLEHAKKIANFLLGMQKSDGLFYATYNAKTGELGDTQDKWSTQSGSYHAKVAMGLIDLYEVCGDERYLNSAIKICNAALLLQKPEGRFISFSDSGATHMHPHSYSAEGLLYAGIKLGNNEYLEAARRATEWALAMQLETGGVPCIVADEVNKNERSDTLAQTLRLAALLLSSGLINHKTKIDELRKRLLGFQHRNGGFIYGSDETGKKMNHTNSWCTMFALQALDLYNKHFNNQEKIFVDLLV
ncbi:MAG: DapH/DapD/GlmU-related protein [Candidatus Aenigmatarchaeota archaeon]